MRVMDWNFGMWKAKAQVEQVDHDRLMAVICTTDKNGSPASASRHTVVFEHCEGCDTGDETRQVVEKLLRARYGN